MLPPANGGPEHELGSQCSAAPGAARAAREVLSSAHAMQARAQRRPLWRPHSPHSTAPLKRPCRTHVAPAVPAAQPDGTSQAVWQQGQATKLN